MALNKFLCHQELDLIATGLTQTYARSQAVDFCVPYVIEPGSMLIPYPELDSDTIAGISKPYQFDARFLYFMQHFYLFLQLFI